MSAAAMTTTTVEWKLAYNDVAHVVAGGVSACGKLGTWAQWRALPDGEPSRCSRCKRHNEPGTVGYVEMCAAGLTYRQVQHWSRRGLLRPIRRLPGTGHALRFPDSEVGVAALMARLTTAGVLPEAAERVARGGDLAPGLRIVTDGGEPS